MSAAAGAAPSTAAARIVANVLLIFRLPADPGPNALAHASLAK